jgi:KDO2-lipid IV(A) lauroyltransferase
MQPMLKATAAPPADHRSAAEFGLDQLYRIGWRAGPLVPRRLQRIMARSGAAVARCRGGVHLDQLRENLTTATGRPVTDDLLHRALVSYLRNLIEVFALPGRSAAGIVSDVTTVGEEHLRRAFADTGAVVALPHSGNWDLAGAWACVTGMPVTTVVEQLTEPQYSAFRSFRESLGMQVIAHRDPAALADLVAAVRAGRLACLVADRDLSGTGLPVSWRGHPIRMPAGPAVVARRAGAALLPAACTFTAAGIRLTIGRPIAPRPGRTGLAWMTQRLADFFAGEVAHRPQDWHMMQPFFTPETNRDDESSTRPGADSAADSAAGFVARNRSEPA